MSYRFEPGEPVARGVRRMAREQIDRAIAEIDDPRRDHHEQVHQVRKRAKKLRALARLVRPVLGAEYQAINGYYRDLARPLAAARDAQALVETHERLLAAADHVAADDYAAMGRALAARRDRQAADLDLPRRLARAREALLVGRAAVDTWPLATEGFAAVRGGLRKVAGRHRKARRRASATGEPADIHQWRKRAKYLRYQLRVLRPLWPAVMKAMRDEAHQLTDQLGEHHDLHLLATTVAAEPPLDSRPEAAAYRDLIARRQAELLAAAMVPGARLAVEKPKRLARRLARYDRIGDRLA